jgi:hypothetical protein
VEENYTYEIMSGSTCFVPTPQNSSCTGGTISDIFVTDADENTDNVSYILTLKELRSCSGFENVSREEADRIIQSLYQLSVITYQIFIND